MDEAGTSKPSGKRVRLAAGRASSEAFPQSPQLEVVRKFRASRFSSTVTSGERSTRTRFRMPSEPAGGPQLSARSMSSRRRTSPSANRKPTASSTSQPGVRMVTVMLRRVRPAPAP